MSCECYRIGGPFISFDPECPAHGYEAQREERERAEADERAAEEKASLLQRIEELERKVAELQGNR